MANELIQFDNLRAVLEEFAQEFKDNYRAQLVAHGRFTRDGQDRLIDSIDSSMNTVQAMIREGDGAWSVTINLNEYWKYVENDTRPHWPPLSAIQRWVEIKPVIPRPDDKGRIPSPKSLAFLIGRAMAGLSPNQSKLKNPQGGTKGTHDFQTAQETAVERFRVRIRVAMIKDVQNYVRQVLARK